MFLENQNQEAEKTDGHDLEDLRKKYAELAEKLPDKDKKACLSWLNGDKESRDRTILTGRLSFLEKSVRDSEQQISKYAQELKDRAGKGLVRGETKDERLDWFKKLSFVERAKILESKKADLDDLFDPKREKNMAEFTKLWEYFGGSKPHHAAFLGKELKDREKTVTELAAKRKILDGAILPTIVRDQLKKQGLGLELSPLKSLVDAVRKTHERQKMRFGKLPPKVQEEIKNDFKKKLLPERQKMLEETEASMEKYRQAYERQMAEKLAPDKAHHGLTLFSQKSAPKYRDWFVTSSLSEMKDFSGRDPNLQNPERRLLVQKMSFELTRMPAKLRAKTVKEFNELNLEGRRGLVEKHASGEEAKNAAADSEKKGLVHRLIRRLTFSGGHEKIGQTVETYAIAREMAERRKRAQLSRRDAVVPQELHHEAPSAAPAISASVNAQTTAKRTSKIEQAMQSDRLKDAGGHAKLKLDILETNTGDRKRLERALKTDVDNQEAKLEGNILLRNRTGEAVSDAREYERGEVHRELERVINALAPELEKGAQAEGTPMTAEDIKKIAEDADWKGISKDVLRKAA